MQAERRYLTDDRDLPEEHQCELVILQGGNGDWYIGSVPKGEGFVGRLVRISTSGGAASACPGLGRAIAEAYRAMERAGMPATARETIAMSNTEKVNPTDVTRRGGFRRIDIPEAKPCRSPEHNPPTHIHLPPGTYEYTCPVCGATMTIHVPEVMMLGHSQVSSSATGGRDESSR